MTESFDENELYRALDFVTPSKDIQKEQTVHKSSSAHSRGVHAAHKQLEKQIKKIQGLELNVAHALSDAAAVDDDIVGGFCYNIVRWCGIIQNFRWIWVYSSEAYFYQNPLKVSHEVADLFAALSDQALEHQKRLKNVKTRRARARGELYFADPDDFCKVTDGAANCASRVLSLPATKLG
jgi:hypothetical protein